MRKGCHRISCMVRIGAIVNYCGLRVAGKPFTYPQLWSERLLVGI